MFSLNMLAGDYVSNWKYDVDFEMSPPVFKGDQSVVFNYHEDQFNSVVEQFALKTRQRMLDGALSLLTFQLPTESCPVLGGWP